MKNGQTATRYIDEASLPQIKEKLDGMAKATAHFSANDSGDMMIGSVCPGEKAELPLVFGYHLRYSQKPVLTVSGPGLPIFEFTGPTPSELADILAHAIRIIPTMDRE